MLFSNSIHFIRFNSIYFQTQTNKQNTQVVNRELYFTSKWNNDNTLSNTIIQYLQGKANYKLQKTKQQTKTEHKVMELEGAH